MTPATEQYLRAHRADAPAEIRAALAADLRFAQRIYADDLNGLFGRQPLIPLKIKDAVKAFPRTEETMLLLAGIDRLLETARLGGRAGWLATDEAEIAGQIRQFAPAIVQAGVLTSPEVDALLELAGGDYYDKDLTEPEIADYLAALDQADAAQALRQRAGHAYNAVVAVVDGGETDWDALAGVFAAEPAEGG